VEQAREDRVRARAHELWEQAGRPEGVEAEHWRLAEAEIDAAEGSGAAPAPSGAAGSTGGAATGASGLSSGLQPSGLATSGAGRGRRLDRDGRREHRGKPSGTVNGSEGCGEEGGRRRVSTLWSGRGLGPRPEVQSERRLNGSASFQAKRIRPPSRQLGAAIRESRRRFDIQRQVGRRGYIPGMVGESDGKEKRSRGCYSPARIPRSLAGGGEVEAEWGRGRLAAGDAACPWTRRRGGGARTQAARLDRIGRVEDDEARAGADAQAHDRSAR
jgi:hypothetical protein